jgi:hypothetical protein
VDDFVSEPHHAVCCDYRQENILNLVAAESEENRQASVLLSRENPEKLLKEWSKIKEHGRSPWICPGTILYPRARGFRFPV